MTKIHRAQKLGRTSVIFDKAGNCMAVIDVIGAIDPEGIANQVVEALNAQASREGDQS